MSIHGNDYHNPDFEQEGAAAVLVGAHEVKTTGIHGVGASTVESAAGSQAKVDAHKDLATGVHGAGSNYLAQAPAASHLVRAFTKGWTSGKLLKGGGVNADPSEISGWEKMAEVILAATANYIDFTNLDINSDTFYIILATIKEAAAGAFPIALYRNADYTDTNYYSQYFQADGATVGGGRQNAPYITAIYAGESTALFVTVHRDPDGYMLALATSNFRRGSNISFVNRHNSSTNTTTNITSLRLYSAVASSLGIGSTFSLFKPRTS